MNSPCFEVTIQLYTIYEDKARDNIADRHDYSIRRVHSSNKGAK